MTTVYRADVVGSLLRPEYLKQARARWNAAEIATAEFKRLEDRAVDQAIALQEAKLQLVSEVAHEVWS